MNPEPTLRALAGAAALLGGRALSWWRLAATGLLLGGALFGLAAQPFPAPSLAAFFGVVLAALLALLYERLWSPIVSEAARASAALGLPLAAAAALALRRQPSALALAGAAAALAAVSLFGAHAAIANAEAGWRRAAYWAAALASPGLVGLAAAWAAVEPPSGAPVTGIAALTLALLAWLAPALLERSRAARELVEEVRLGFVPEDDVQILKRPFRRSSEPSFGRADERREYVRAALLLAVARQQQRRRSGEAIRLRQLEVLAFRTRMRRALEVRAERARLLSLQELDREEG